MVGMVGIQRFQVKGMKDRTRSEGRLIYQDHWVTYDEFHAACNASI